MDCLAFRPTLATTISPGAASNSPLTGRGARVFLGLAQKPSLKSHVWRGGVVLGKGADTLPLATVAKRSNAVHLKWDVAPTHWLKVLAASEKAKSRRISELSSPSDN